MKKYTIIYGEWWNSGSNRHSITKFDRVETDDLKTLIATDKYDCNVWFVFEGWPELEGEFKE